QKQPAEDKAEISKRSWIWIVMILLGANVYQYQKNKEEQLSDAAEIRRLNEERVRIYDKTYSDRAENKRIAKELFKLSNWLFEKDTAAYRRLDFDSAYNHKQSGDAGSGDD